MIKEREVIFQFFWKGREEKRAKSPADEVLICMVLCIKNAYRYTK